MVKKGLKYSVVLLLVISCIICLNFISAVAPTFIPAGGPSNVSLFYGNQSLSVDFNATNTSAFGWFAVNDSRFLITQTGFITNNQTATLTNISPMAVGNYIIRVNATSALGENTSLIYRVQVNKSNYFDCGVVFNLTSPQVFPKVFTVWTNCTTGFVLTRNGTVIDNNSAQINLAVTAYNFSVARNDTANYTYYANNREFRITPDAVEPTFTNNAVNNTERGQAAKFSINVTDNAALNSNGSYIFSINQTGAWVNNTVAFFATTPQVIEVTKVLNSSLGVFISYRWFFNDTSGNTNATTIYNLTTTADVTSPIYSGSAIETTYAGRANAFTIDVSDGIALTTNGQYIFSTDNSGSWVNDSAVNFTANTETARSVKNLNSTIDKVISYRWYFTDNSGNTNSTSVYTLTTILYPGAGSGTLTGGSTHTTPTEYAADNQFSTVGDEYTLKYLDKISFTVGSSGHSLTLNQFSITEARITIASTPMSATLQKGVLYSYDLSGDGVNDINVRYVGMVGTKAVIFVQGIAPVVSPPAEETPATPSENTNDNTNDGTNSVPSETINSSSSPWKIIIIVVVILVIILVVVLLTKKKQKTKRHYMYGY